MRGFLILLIIGLGVAAYFTRPSLDAHRARVAQLMEMQGLSPPGEAGKVEGFRDVYLGTQYMLKSNDALVMHCFGAFTQFVCLQPETPPTESF